MAEVLIVVHSDIEFPGPTITCWNGLFHFLSIQNRGMNVKIQGTLWLGIWFFHGFLSQGIIFPGGKFAQLPFSGVGEWWFFSDIISFVFLRDIKSKKIQFPMPRIYESDNHFFQDVLVFKNLIIYTPVWIKNGIAQYLKYYKNRPKSPHFLTVKLKLYHHNTLGDWNSQKIDTLHD